MAGDNGGKGGRGKEGGEERKERGWQIEREKGRGMILCVGVIRKVADHSREVAPGKKAVQQKGRS